MARPFMYQWDELQHGQVLSPECGSYQPYNTAGVRQWLKAAGGEGPGGVGWQLNTGLKLCQERFKLVIRKSASVDRVVRGCDGLRQAAVLSPPLQVLERWWMWH